MRPPDITSSGSQFIHTTFYGYITRQKHTSESPHTHVAFVNCTCDFWWNWIKVVYSPLSFAGVWPNFHHNKELSNFDLRHLYGLERFIQCVTAICNRQEVLSTKNIWYCYGQFHFGYITFWQIHSGRLIEMPPTTVWWASICLKKPLILNSRV